MNNNTTEVHSTLEKVGITNDPILLKSLTTELGMKASHSRNRIILHIASNPREYFTAKEIYNKLIKEIPSLSKATVYNTLNILKERNILKDIKTTDQKETRFYLSLTSTIAHFKCNKCNQVYPIQLDDIKDILKDKLGEEWKTKSIEIIYSGACNNCHQQSKKEKSNIDYDNNQKENNP
ncbi:transcriptional repressor [Borrelia miyamotoi]|uniref:Transcriptional repressor n=1 Tax=Borrelia miyamotoi TaxID=47466 RepID=A0AAP8YRK4_9SPIR|nr:transcriptional repressor [Borrelia miyamotoi]AHH04765.1 Oxidative stress response regulator BosR [Borrelia miyamotoi FR64b]ATQ14607.1 transcriptional repressor [Borrelia miyamotoi]ATQ15792.1 transcriptional repressor [Borrelia miyamotoi]ATQ16936.1 transcriptional repressor [Borrelia miyamotoi]ATQ18559.1 transcriptional repressor [Borrelia miyamotoi]